MRHPYAWTQVPPVAQPRRTQFSIPCPCQSPYTNPLRHLEDFCRECEQHDRELRQYAAEKLENGREIAGKMKLTEIVMYYDGDYDTYFTYDKYTINISGGTKGADYIWMGAG